MGKLRLELVDLKGNFSHLHLILDVAEHLGMELRLGLSKLTYLVHHDLLYLLARLSHLLISKFVLEFSDCGLLLSKRVLSFNLLPLRLVLLVS